MVENRITLDVSLILGQILPKVSLFLGQKSAKMSLFLGHFDLSCRFLIELTRFSAVVQIAINMSYDEVPTHKSYISNFWSGHFTC
jgi:hypothetical protein